MFSDYSKIPAYNSKVIKGTMVILPHPLWKRLYDLKDLSVDTMSSLPDPEVYIIINGRRTKNNIMWQLLVNVNKL